VGRGGGAEQGGIDGDAPRRGRKDGAERSAWDGGSDGDEGGCSWCVRAKKAQRQKKSGGGTLLNDAVGRKQRRGVQR
jgi:hypothetical protein